MEPVSDSSWDTKLQELDGSFLQASAWAAFQKARGTPVHKLEGDGWQCLLMEQESRLRRYLFAPYGPTLARPELLKTALEELAVFGRNHHFQWVRVEPCLGLSKNSDFTDLSSPSKPTILPAHKQINPRYTRVLDLRPDEDAILGSVSPSTRSLVRRHEREPVLTFRTSTEPKDMSLFIDMIHTVAQRNQVLFHSDAHYIREAEVLMPRGDMRLEFALLKDKPIACIVMHDFNAVTTYTYAASLPEARDVSASALLLWQAIRNAKAAGLTRLDLFGVAPEDAAPSHPWYGFSAFKRKFGGTVIKRGQTLDIPLGPRYYAYRSAIRILKRH